MGTDRSVTEVLLSIWTDDERAVGSRVPVPEVPPLMAVTQVEEEVPLTVADSVTPVDVVTCMTNLAPCQTASHDKKFAHMPDDNKLTDNYMFTNGSLG